MAAANADRGRHGAGVTASWLSPPPSTRAISSCGCALLPARQGTRLYLDLSQPALAASIASPANTRCGKKTLAALKLVAHQIGGYCNGRVERLYRIRTRGHDLAGDPIGPIRISLENGGSQLVRQHIRGRHDLAL